MIRMRSIAQIDIAYTQYMSVCMSVYRSDCLYRVTHKKWNMHAFHRSSSLNIVFNITTLYCNDRG